MPEKCQHLLRMKTENPSALIKEVLVTDLSTLAMMLLCYYCFFLPPEEGCFHILPYASVRLHVRTKGFLSFCGHGSLRLTQYHIFKQVMFLPHVVDHVYISVSFLPATPFSPFLSAVLCIRG